MYVPAFLWSKIRIVITDHNYEKMLEVATRLTLIRDGVLMELTDKRGLVEQGYLSSIY